MINLPKKSPRNRQDTTMVPQVTDPMSGVVLTACLVNVIALRALSAPLWGVVKSFEEYLTRL